MTKVLIEAGIAVVLILCSSRILTVCENLRIAREVARADRRHAERVKNAQRRVVP